MGGATRTKATEPTARQLEMLAFFREYYRLHSVPPSVRDVMRRFELKSPNGVSGHIAELVRFGLLKKTLGVGQSRGFLPTDMAPKVQILNSETVAVFRMGVKIGVMIADQNGKIIHSGLHTGTEIVGFAKKMRTEVLACTLETAKLAAEAYAAKLVDVVST